MSIRKYKKSVIFGCAAVAAALVVLPAAARTWHGLWSNDAETGALVATVDPDGPAAGAGLQRGDIIVQVDGAAIENHRDFLAAISDNGVDDTLDLELRRGNESVSLSLTVGETNRGPYLGLLIVPDGAGAFRPRPSAISTTAAGAGSADAAATAHRAGAAWAAAGSKSNRTRRRPPAARRSRRPDAFRHRPRPTGDDAYGAIPGFVRLSIHA